MSSSSRLAAPSPAEESPDRGGDSQIKSLSVPGLLAGGAAAATTSVIGGQLGISGTVAGAAITSVISAAVVAFYTDSVNGTARKLKQVAVRAGERAPSRDRGASVHSSRTRREADGGTGEAVAEATDAAETPEPSRGRRLLKIALMSLVIGLIGMAAVFGIQRISGTELSPGTGQIQRSVTGTDSVSPREDSGSSTDDGTEQQEGTDGQQQDGREQDVQQQDGTGADGSGEQSEGTTEDGSSPADEQQGEDADGTGGDSGSSGSSSSSESQDGASSGSGASEQIG
ncbi:hypothetical protein [Brachybacterium sp. EE-P12]|uniref:Uncharacterized protein n=2 Tax=Brachybacterium TaxID=43668 RepID=A0A921GLQ3_9MICO|nr:hypothetical protein [Brachybacterium sp. EE-P12]HJC69987.1 hypothetical protein [Candidatus Brachybacterium intestinipullorum]HJF49082.1 hypothetical protein [Brachybacterium paraconglomeratum]